MSEGLEVRLFQEHQNHRYHHYNQAEQRHWPPQSNRFSLNTNSLPIYLPESAPFFPYYQDENQELSLDYDRKTAAQNKNINSSIPGFALRQLGSFHERLSWDTVAGACRPSMRAPTLYRPNSTGQQQHLIAANLNLNQNLNLNLNQNNEHLTNQNANFHNKRLPGGQRMALKLAPLASQYQDQQHSSSRKQSLPTYRPQAQQIQHQQAAMNVWRAPHAAGARQPSWPPSETSPRLHQHQCLGCDQEEPDEQSDCSCSLNSSMGADFSQSQSQSHSHSSHNQQQHQQHQHNHNLTSQQAEHSQPLLASSQLPAGQHHSRFHHSQQQHQPLHRPLMPRSSVPSGPLIASAATVVPPLIRQATYTATSDTVTDSSLGRQLALPLTPPPPPALAGGEKQHNGSGAAATTTPAAPTAISDFHDPAKAGSYNQAVGAEHQQLGDNKASQASRHVVSFRRSATSADPQQQQHRSLERRKLHGQHSAGLLTSHYQSSASNLIGGQAEQQLANGQPNRLTCPPSPIVSAGLNSTSLQQQQQQQHLHQLHHLQAHPLGVANYPPSSPLPPLRPASVGSHLLSSGSAFDGPISIPAITSHRTNSPWMRISSIILTPIGIVIILFIVVSPLLHYLM